MKMRIALCALIPCLLMFGASKQPPLETGHVVSQNLSSEAAGAYAAPIGTAVIGIPLYRTSNIAVVDVGQFQYTWMESRNRHPLVLTVNGDVQFYRDKNWFVVLDANGGKHRFSLTGSRQK